MAKPATRLPRATRTVEPAPASVVAPAPDNGVPFASRPVVKNTAEPIKRRGKQLGARVPDEMYDRLVACSAQTRIPQGRLLERALDVELQSHGF